MLLRNGLATRYSPHQCYMRVPCVLWNIYIFLVVASTLRLAHFSFSFLRGKPRLKRSLSACYRKSWGREKYTMLNAYLPDNFLAVCILLKKKYATIASEQKKRSEQREVNTRCQHKPRKQTNIGIPMQIWAVSTNETMANFSFVWWRKMEVWKVLLAQR